LLKDQKKDITNDDTELSSTVGFAAQGAPKRIEHNIEDLEKLREALMDNMIIQQNELKFLVNVN